MIRFYFEVHIFSIKLFYDIQLISIYPFNPIDMDIDGWNFFKKNIDIDMNDEKINRYMNIDDEKINKYRYGWWKIDIDMDDEKNK